MVEILIIGQGVSGTLLSWFLESKKRSFLVIDRADPQAASRIAAGIINPLTGRRLVKTWNIDELYPFAKQTYSALSTTLSQSILNELKVVKVFPTADMREFWAKRSQEAEVQSYFEGQQLDAEVSKSLHPQEGFAQYGPAMQIDLPELCKGWRELLRKSGRLIEEKFEHDQLLLPNVRSPFLRYKELAAKKIVFCEGHRMTSNPWFEKVPMRANPGQRLIVKLGLPEGYLFRNRGLTVSLGDGRCWSGATSDFGIPFGPITQPPQVNAKGLQHLSAKLDALSPLNWELLDHNAGFRPTIKDRRPVVGRHPLQPALYVLNGMGTKGASLAPFHAAKLADQLEHDLAMEAAQSPANHLRDSHSSKSEVLKDRTQTEHNGRSAIQADVDVRRFQ